MDFPSDVLFLERTMNITIDPNGTWYHGSDAQFSELRTGSTITQWRALAEAFSHQPKVLCCEDDGSIIHNGKKHGYLYVIDEPVVVGEDSVVESLSRSSAADFGLRAELPFVEQLVAAVADERNMVEKERKIDNIRWAELSELTTFDYFDLNAVIAYLVKANMVARWAVLDAKVGREMFERLVSELDGKEMINKL